MPKAALLLCCLPACTPCRAHLFIELGGALQAECGSLDQGFRQWVCQPQAALQVQVASGQQQSALRILCTLLQAGFVKEAGLEKPR